jgi:septum formation protein
VAPPPLVLASASPRRQALLAGLGLRFDVVPSGIPEGGAAGPALRRAPALALAKAQEVAARVRRGLVLGADTIVECDGQPLGKPSDAGAARAALRALSGRTHQVVTGVAVVEAPAGRSETGAAVTEVTFRPLTEADIAAYVETGEPFGKAGAYAIQGLGSLLVEGIRGSPSNVIGLPVTLVRDLLARFGVDLWRLRR